MTSASTRPPITNKAGQVSLVSSGSIRFAEKKGIKNDKFKYSNELKEARLFVANDFGKHTYARTCSGR